MKRFVLSLVLFALSILLVSSFQAAIYFLPFPPPNLWLIVFAYFCYYRSITTLLVFNIFLTLLLLQMTSVNPGPLILVLNIITIFAKVLQDRVHLTYNQMILSTGIVCFLFNLGIWLVQYPKSGLYLPNVFAWFSSSLSTLICAPVVFYPVYKLDQWLCRENSDTLENLLV